MTANITPLYPEHEIESELPEEIAAGIDELRSMLDDVECSLGELTPETLKTLDQTVELIYDILEHGTELIWFELDAPALAAKHCEPPEVVRLAVVQDAGV